MLSEHIQRHELILESGSTQIPGSSPQSAETKQRANGKTLWNDHKSEKKRMMQMEYASICFHHYMTFLE